VGGAFPVLLEFMAVPFAAAGEGIAHDNAIGRDFEHRNVVAADGRNPHRGDEGWMEFVKRAVTASASNMWLSD